MYSKEDMIHFLLIHVDMIDTTLFASVKEAANFVNCKLVVKISGL